MTDLVFTIPRARSFLRVDDIVDDDDIADAIAAAQGWIEDTTILILTRRTVVETFDRLDCRLELRSWPVVSTDQISYVDPTGATLMLAAGGWWANVAARPVRITPAIGTLWPRGYRGSGAVTVTMTAGFATAADIPMPVIHALKLLVSHFYTNRTPVEVGLRAAAIEVPLTVADLLRKWVRKVI